MSLSTYPPLHHILTTHLFSKFESVGDTVLLLLKACLQIFQGSMYLPGSTIKEIATNPEEAGKFVFEVIPGRWIPD